ncbi:MAG: hypothetical protein KJP02_10135 [Octadecabacter sp.]|nr:hypothetical protein [Octadecabacter sp.]
MLIAVLGFGVLVATAHAQDRYDPPDAGAGSALSGAEQVWYGADALWPDLPQVRRVANMAEPCGAQGAANPRIFYCTSPNLIYISEDFEQSQVSVYEMAHVLGHALQVRHGIADIALREVRRRPDEEQALRTLVTRQVDCLAGFLVAHVGLWPREFETYRFKDEPFTGAHWGRDPVRIGPQVSIGLGARAQAYDRGYEARDPAVCAMGELPIEPILTARR